MVYNVALADEPVSPSWKVELNTAGECTAQSYPNLERAVACHEELLAKCMETKKDDFEPCMREAVEIWAVLAKTYADHEEFEAIALQYDPNRCDELNGGSEQLLQCQFTGYTTQAIFGHIASIWGELPD